MAFVQDQHLADFVCDEAALLDAARYEDWLALFADDGRYWVPLLGAHQADDRQHNALADEDRLLLSLRVQRLRNPRAHSQHPGSACQHVLQAPRVQRRDDAAGVYELATPFVYIESRGGHPLMLAGSYVHTLAADTAGDLRIRLKRVNLLDAAQPLPMVQLFI